MAGPFEPEAWSMKGHKLTEKQQRFCEEYLKDLNGTRAAIRAGYSKKTADVICNQLIRKTWVREEIVRLQAERSVRTKVDADWVLLQLKEIFEADRTQIYQKGGKKLKPFEQWPPRLRQLVKTLKPAEIHFFGDPVRVLELIGKHIQVKAFVEKHELTGKDGGPIQTEGRILVEFVDADSGESSDPSEV
jgi:phage terminase small subunit